MRFGKGVERVFRDLRGPRPERAHKRRVRGALQPIGSRAANPLAGVEGRPPGLGGAEGFPLVDGPHYLDALGALHRRLKPDWYLEIGTFKGASLRLARGRAIAVDPAFALDGPPPPGPEAHYFQTTSDAFFESGFLERNGIAPDLCYIDGLHHAEASLRDFANAERRMAADGLIVLDDCLPTSHVMAERDWDHARTRFWTGDIWKTVVALLETRPDLRITVLDAWPTGLALVCGLDPSAGAEAAQARLAGLLPLSLADYGVERYFAAFEIVNAFDAVSALPPGPADPLRAAPRPRAAAADTLKGQLTHG